MISFKTILSILPSLFVFLAGSFLFLRNGLPKNLRILVSSLLLLLLIVSNAYLIADSLSGNGIDESVVFHLRHGVEGAGFKDFFKLYLIGILFFAVSIISSLFVFKKIKDTPSVQKTRSAYAASFIAIAFIIHPAVGDALTLINNASSFNALPPANQNEAYGFSQLYEAPTGTPKLKVQPNIVYIYAESFERTYFNQSIFPGLIQNLRKWESRSINFTNVKQVAGTGWTIAGMVASQCGIPLVTTGSNGNSMGAMDQFLPGATCLGELLNRAGYQLTYRGGADLNFAGKGKFYKTHGFTDVKGFHELKNELQDQSYRTGWGLYDDTTFDIAYKDFLSLSEKKKPFGLFMLTLDTHHPEGHMPKRCENVRYEDGSNPILNAVSCSDKLIGEFLDKIASSPYADDTLVVVASDHFAMPNTARSQLESAERRK